MPKSRNRKNHKKKVVARKVRVEAQQKQAIKQMELLKEKYVEEMSKQAKEGEDVGDVPFTLGDK
jgi:hypothetical protein